MYYKYLEFPHGFVRFETEELFNDYISTYPNEDYIIREANL